MSGKVNMVASVLHDYVQLIHSHAKRYVNTCAAAFLMLPALGSRMFAVRHSMLPIH